MVYPYAILCYVLSALYQDVGDWLSGRALPSHGRGHWFESSIAHHILRELGISAGLYLFLVS